MLQHVHMIDGFISCHAKLVYNGHDKLTETFFKFKPVLYLQQQKADILFIQSLHWTKSIVFRVLETLKWEY